MGKITFTEKIEKLRVELGVSKVKLQEFLKNTAPMETEDEYLPLIVAEFKVIDGTQEDDTEESRVFVGYHPITGKEVYR